MRAQILRYGAVFAVVFGLGAWTASAGSISQSNAIDVGIAKDLNDPSSSRLVLHAPFSTTLGEASSPKPVSIQGVLDRLKDAPSIGSPGFFGGLVGGRPNPIKIGLPGVNPIPEPRTWLLYGFGALIGAWVVRKELRAS